MPGGNRMWSSVRNMLRRIGAITLWQVLKGLVFAATGVVLLAVILLFAVSVWPNRQMPLDEPVKEIVYLDQGWGPTRESPARQTYYYTPQGTSIKGMRYSWLVNLEQAWSTKRFADPDHLRTYGFIIDLAPTAANPRQLPVGFTHHFDNQVDDEVLDLTCAACHTGQLTTFKDGQRVAIRVDGGQAMHAFTGMNPRDFLPDLILALSTTYLYPPKFNRFARNVLGAERYADGKSALHSALGGVLATFLKQGWNDKSKHLYPVEEGYGRTDAIGRIANTVFGDHITPANYRPGDAPVNYPPVWDIWKFDWVQYGASVRHPLARNVGEGMGVGSAYTLVNGYGLPTPATDRYQSSTMVENLYQIEKTLWYLQPPKWPDNLLGKIDCQRAIYGKTLFTQYCARCHGPHLSSADMVAIDAPCKTPATHWIMTVLKAKDIGTDPHAADNFANNRLDLSPTGLTSAEVRKLREPLLREQLARQLALLKPGSDERRQAEINGNTAIQQQLDQTDMRSVSIGFGLNYFGLLIREQYRSDPRNPPAAAFPPDRGADDGYFGEVDIPQQPPSYKARPLAGIWATPPFLHNGSVPNLYQLLSPVEKRDSKFLVGTKDFDAKNVGYVLRPLTETGFIMDTSIAGNSNHGHEFRGTDGPKPPPPTGAACYTGADTTPLAASQMGPPKDGVIGPEFTDDQRMAIIEYLKVHRDDPDTGEFPDYCYCKGAPPPKPAVVTIPKCSPSAAPLKQQKAAAVPPVPAISGQR